MPQIMVNIFKSRKDRIEVRHRLTAISADPYRL